MANVITLLQRGTGPFAIFASAARTATPDTQEFDAILVGPRALDIIIDVTAVTATPTLTVTVSLVDRVSGKVTTLLASAGLTGTGTTVLHIGPGSTAAANLVLSRQIPPVFRIEAAHTDADSITYSIGGILCR